MADKQSRWVPLESNPDVLNSWSHKVGLVLSQDTFTDVYGLDEELLGIVPQPVKAVVLLFPITEAMETKKKEEDAKTEEGSLPIVDPTVVWIKQTISNACGTIGLLHALMNSRVTIAPESPLAEFIEQCKGISPTERAKLLETTPLFANVHAAEASSGQSAVPTNLDTDYHFTCFVQAPSMDPGKVKGEEGKRLIELDGRRVGPIDRGPSENLLKDVAAFVKERFISQSDSVNLNMIALAPPEA
ncbi:peptidase C12, ubiquitin carboxyl-terminal hydrolase 1 [Phellopilus nigrolimitatus]|nr:peptidase C12, ubiquitin carboxyl-terminal hydrolase 1 [Phellopilus nigrolimitatus]